MEGKTLVDEAHFSRPARSGERETRKNEDALLTTKAHQGVTMAASSSLRGLKQIVRGQKVMEGGGVPVRESGWENRG